MTLGGGEVMDDYTPSEKAIRSQWNNAVGIHRLEQRNAEFDRWLAEHDREVEARGVEKAIDALDADTDEWVEFALGGIGAVGRFLRTHVQRVRER